MRKWTFRVSGALASVVLVSALFFIWTGATDDKPKEDGGEGNATTTVVQNTVVAATPPPISTSVATDSPPTPVVERDKFHKGTNILIYGNDPSFEVKFERLLNRLVRDNVTHVSLNIPLYQDGWDSSTVSTFEETPSDDIVRRAIDMAQESGLSVIVRPLIDERGINQVQGMWRGVIVPPDPAVWHESYRTLIVHYAEIAEQEGAEIVCIGGELVSLTEEDDLPYWNQLIDEVRSVFSGQLTYSQNHNALKMDTGFWDRMDYIGIDAFYQFDLHDQATVEELIEAWEPYVEELQQLEERFGKPVLITEVGVTSQLGSYRTPWTWDHSTAVDLETQSRYYAATCAAVRETVVGIYFWTANVDPPKDPLQDEGFDFQGKPSEETLRTCYAN